MILVDAVTTFEGRKTLILGRFISNVVSLVKTEDYDGFKLILIQEIDFNGKPQENIYVSVDLIGVGIDEIVLAANETSSRGTELTYKRSIDSVTIAKIETQIFEDGEADIDKLKE